MTTAEKSTGLTWPLLITPDGLGGVFVRATFGRDKVLNNIRLNDDGEVMSLTVPGFRLEVSFHNSPDDAEQALKREIALGLAAGASPEGRA
jgi:hypothetical protein